LNEKVKCSSAFKDCSLLAVGARSPKAKNSNEKGNETQSTKEKWRGENEASSCFNLFSTRQRGARAGLFIGEVKGLLTMP
jgi:hypothetical protein